MRRCELENLVKTGEKLKGKREEKGQKKNT